MKYLLDAAALRDSRQREGRDIGINDCLTAAHAQTSGLVCVTANRKHFDRVRGLPIEDWTAV